MLLEPAHAIFCLFVWHLKRFKRLLLVRGRESAEERYRERDGWFHSSTFLSKYTNTKNHIWIEFTNSKNSVVFCIQRIFYTQEQRNQNVISRYFCCYIPFRSARRRVNCFSCSNSFALDLFGSGSFHLHSSYHTNFFVLFCIQCYVGFLYVLSSQQLLCFYWLVSRIESNG